MENDQITIVNAVIIDTKITIEDHGFVAIIELDYGGAARQGFGAFTSYFEGYQKDVAGQHITRLMEIAGVRTWSSLRGRSLRVKKSGYHTIEAIGHIVEDDWYAPKQDLPWESGATA